MNSHKLEAGQLPTLHIDGKEVPVRLKVNPRARRLIVRVQQTNGEVVVTAPTRTSLKQALAFANSEKAWIANSLADVEAPICLLPGQQVPFKGEPHLITHAPEKRGSVWQEQISGQNHIVCTGDISHVPRRVRDWLKAQAKKDMSQLAFAFGEQVGKKPTRLTFRDAQTRWGSCSSSGVISLSWRLILAPSHVMNYVVAHEVAHLIHLNHGQKFWRLVEQLVGNTSDARGWLDSSGASLHRYGTEAA